jgi:hypothetical protein
VSKYAAYSLTDVSEPLVPFLVSSIVRFCYFAMPRDSCNVALLAKHTKSICTAAGKANAVCFLRPRYVGGGEADHHFQSCMSVELALYGHVLQEVVFAEVSSTTDPGSCLFTRRVLNTCDQRHNELAQIGDLCRAKLKPNLTHGSKHFCFGGQRTTSRSGGVIMAVCASKTSSSFVCRSRVNGPRERTLDPTCHTTGKYHKFLIRREWW